MAKKTLVLVLLLVLGSSISSGRYVEDSSERQREDYEEAEENEHERDMNDEDEDDDFDESYDEREDSDARHRDTAAMDEEDEADGREEGEVDAREEVVKIHPGQSEDSEQSEQEDEDTSEDGGERFEDGDDLNDERMMDGDEGGFSLAGHDEEENLADQGGFESFKRKADEINQENENIQTEIRNLKAKFDEALKSDSVEAAPGLLADDAKEEIRDDTSHHSLSKASSYMSSRTRGQHTAFSEDDAIRQYEEIGEDANIAPDDDY